MVFQYWRITEFKLQYGHNINMIMLLKHKWYTKFVDTYFNIFSFEPTKRYNSLWEERYYKAILLWLLTSEMQFLKCRILKYIWDLRKQNIYQ
jgi:hypothetical protein